MHISIDHSRNLDLVAEGMTSSIHPGSWSQVRVLNARKEGPIRKGIEVRPDRSASREETETYFYVHMECESSFIG